MATHETPIATKASVRLYKRIALTFIGFTLVLFGVFLAATLSRATITITAKPVSVKAEVKVAVAADTKTAETVRGLVLATVVSGEKSAAPAGTGTVVQGKATGTVLLVNKRSVPQSLVATTRLFNKDGILFRLKKGVTIPANGELKDVEVQADKEGPESEIGPSTFTVPGLSADLQKLVYAFSEKPMSGGASTVRLVAQSDIDQAVTALKDELTKKAVDELAALSAGKGFTGSAILVEESARSVSAKPGDQASSFTVLLKLTVTGVYYDKTKLQNLGLSALKANVPSDMELGANNLDAAEVTAQNASAAAGTATLNAVFGGEATMTEASSILDKSRLVGLDADMIKAYLKSFDAVGDAEVKLSPFWVTRVPSIKDHIVIKIK